MSASCAAPVSFEALVDYWLGECAPEREASVEEHFFGCAYCTQRLEALAALAAGIRGAFRAGTFRAVISRAFLETIKKEGLRVREYRVAPGASVQCSIGAADDFVVSRLEAALADVQRLDLVELGIGGEAQQRHEDIPFDPAAGEVLVCPAAAALRRMPSHTRRMRLLAVDAAGERVLGDYTFIHAA